MGRQCNRTSGSLVHLIAQLARQIGKENIFRHQAMIDTFRRRRMTKNWSFS